MHFYNPLTIVEMTIPIQVAIAAMLGALILATRRPPAERIFVSIVRWCAIIVLVLIAVGIGNCYKMWFLYMRHAPWSLPVHAERPDREFGGRPEPSMGTH